MEKIFTAVWTVAKWWREFMAFQSPANRQQTNNINKKTIFSSTLNYNNILTVFDGKDYHKGEFRKKNYCQDLWNKPQQSV